MGLIPDNTRGKNLNHQQFGGIFGLLGMMGDGGQQKPSGGGGGVNPGDVKGALDASAGDAEAASGLGEIAELAIL